MIEVRKMSEALGIAKKYQLLVIQKNWLISGSTEPVLIKFGLRLN